MQHSLKIDLHIHSCASRNKDGEKVKNNTLENISVLSDALNEQEVNVCAITDHDTFSYDMYRTLKAEENRDGSILKVLPGVEFSVKFERDDGKKEMVHVVAIFSDKDDDKVKVIEKILQDNPPRDEAAYYEQHFLDVLRAINLDTILIAHQKNSLSSATPWKNDANILGKDRFLEFVHSDYFEAFEFKNKKNEIMNKRFLNDNNLRDKVAFVTGTDCHDWTAYPWETQKDKKKNGESPFPYTYARCLPSFRGLVMAVTDERRLKRVDSFYDTTKFALDCIRITSKGEKLEIPLSRGINVIIGDNSVGKSLLLHALTDYKKDNQKLPAKVKNGYKEYMKRYQIVVEKQLEPRQVFAFDMQGEIREKFDENQLKEASAFLRKYFPEDVHAGSYKDAVQNEIDRMTDYLNRKFEIDLYIRDHLQTFEIQETADRPESLVFIENLRGAKKSAGLEKEVAAGIKKIEGDFLEVLKLNLDQEDQDYFSEQLEQLRRMIVKYQERADKIEENNNRIEIVASAIDRIHIKHVDGATDSHKKQEMFSTHTNALRESIIELIKRKKALTVYKPDVHPQEITPNSNRIHEYEFISKLRINRIDTEYFQQLISDALKAHKVIDWNTITEEELRDDYLLRYDGITPAVQFLKRQMEEKIAQDFSTAHSIISQGMEKKDELSSGMNSKIYFDILSYENTKDGVYIIDQPEDNVSQMAIKSYLLDYFKTMGGNRQIILVTHNPQFIVNLDVDNLIYLSRKDDRLTVQSGALEYECPEYKILDIVADNVDGGLDSIQKRWKRYDKYGTKN